MSVEIEFFFDVVSPYSYLASTQIPKLEAETGATVDWRPFFLGGVMKSANNSPPARVPNKAKYMYADLQRWAERYDIDLQYPSDFPVNSLRAQRLILIAKRLHSDPAPLARRFFEAYWAEGRDISEPEVLKEAIEKTGFDSEQFFEQIEKDDIKKKLEANSNEAVERGAFGAPTFFVGDEMFWGNDRLDFVREAARSK